jgi:beta-glucosidase
MEYTGLIRRMTLEEKVSLFSGADFWHSKSIQRLGVPALSLSDGPHGIRRQVAEADQLGLHPGMPATCFPTAAAVANSWDPALGEALGRALAEEALALQVNVILGPGLNIKRSPLCGRNFEYFSEDPYLAGKLAAAYVRGIQSLGISACPKHFAANSQELFRMASDSVVDERTLREIYLTAFEIAVKEGQPHTIMSSYNMVNGVYAHENPHLLREILVDQWGFRGFVVSDWGGSNDHAAGVAAGGHLEMPASGGSSDRDLAAALQSGLLNEALLERRLEEYLAAISRIKPPPAQVGAFNIEEHHALARKAAGESIVLLKNEGPILPLKAGTRVAVIGEFAEKPRYQGAGSSTVNPTKLETTLERFTASGLDLAGYAPGFNRNGRPDAAKLEAARDLARQAEVVLLYLGLDESAETEGLDREHLRLRQNQIDLLEAVWGLNPNIVVVLSCGAVIEMPWLEHCRGCLHGYLSGQAGASAMLDAVTGRINPSGKLSETYPLIYADTPARSYYPGRERSAQYREGIYVGYRYYDTAGVAVRFPFGYGLSYTSFAYAGLELSAAEVSFTLTNTGPCAGAEIAQLYIGLKGAKVFRAKKELKGFAKVFLESGESRRVSIPLDDKAFRYFNVKTNRFEVEGGDYTISLGASSADIRLSGVLAVAGSGAANPYDPPALPAYYGAAVQDVPDREFEALLGRPIPDPYWDQTAPFGRNDVVSRLDHSKNLVLRLAGRILIHIKNRSLARNDPNLNILFITSMPFRGIARMSGGAVDLPMVDGILKMANGHFFAGLGHLAASWIRMNRANKALARVLLEAGTVTENTQSNG